MQDKLTMMVNFDEVEAKGNVRELLVEIRTTIL